MARNIRNDAASVSMDEMAFTSNHPNVQRGNLSGPIIDRPNRTHRMFSSNAGPPRETPNLLRHLLPISQFLPLEPLPMTDRRCMQSGDLRKVLANGTVGAAPSKLSNSVPVEELKQLKSSVLDTSVKAMSRVKKMDECLHKVNKYSEALNSMRQQTKSKGKSGRSSLVSMDSQILQNSAEFVNQRIEEGTKSVSLNKRIRSSMSGKKRSECQSSTIVRQTLFIGKDQDAGRDSTEGTDVVKEKIRKLPVGGESWEKKMRMKHSNRTVFSKAMDSDGELQKVTQKMKNESSVRLFINEDDEMENPAPHVKGKASRASRSSLKMATNSPSSHSPSKVHLTNGSNNRKRPMPSGSSRIAQWGSQRPQKMHRTRRTNLVSPLSKHDEVPISVDGRTSDLGSKAASVPRTFANGFSSPARLSESEETAAGESQESVGAVVRKNKLKKGSSEGGLQKEGRNSRGSLTGPPLVVKLEIGNSKPLINRSKSRSPPLRKLSDRKDFSCPSNVLTCSNPDIVGESDDDREELLAAVCSASGASYNACSGIFWKKMETIFSSIRTDHISYLEQQVKSSEESHKNLLKNSSHDQVKLARTENSANQVETEGMKLSLYQRVLAALIIEEDVASQDEAEGRKCKDNDRLGYKQLPNFERFAMTSNPPSQMNYELCKNNLQDCLIALSNGIDISCDEEYLQKPIESKLLTELHNIGLHPNNVPDLEDGDEEIDNEISNLQKRRMEKAGKKTALFSQLFKAVKEEEHVNQRALEQTAMDKLVEKAYRKQLATRASYASKHGTPKVSKHVAANFAQRTLARLSKFKETGQSCFSKSPFREALSALPPSLEEQTGSDTLLASGPDGGEKANFAHPFETLATTGSTSNRSKKKELALDEVSGNVSVRNTANSDCTLLSGVKGKRSGNQKTKVKKIARLPTDAKTESSGKMENSADLLKLDLQIDDLDMQSWLNFEGDGLQDDRDVQSGLEIPMDDLSDIFG